MAAGTEEDPYYVSNSEIQNFLRCRRQWYLNYYRRMTPKKRGLAGALPFGSRIHECLERRYANGEDPLAVWDELSTTVWNTQIEREEAEGFADEEARVKLRKEYDLGKAMLEGYVQWVEEEGADEKIELIAAEIIIEADSGVPGMKLRGKLDQRVRRRSDGALMFLDFKTAKSLDDGPALLHLNEQFKFYAMIEWLNALQGTQPGSSMPELTRGGIYRMLKKVLRSGKAQPPFFAQVEMRHNRATLESMWHRTNRRLTDIKQVREQLDAGGDHRYWADPRPTKDCSWDCPFTRICPMMDDSPRESWEAMLAANYTEYDPNARYAESPDVKG